MWIHAEETHGPHGPHGRHCRHRRHHFGPPGPGDLGGWRGPRGRGRKARRGDIRTAALLLLAEEPRNGYQIMQEVSERSAGAWSPSPGSVYPALSQLEDEGLIRQEEAEGRRAFALTDAGRKLVDERDPSQPAPWEQMSGDFGEEAIELGRLMKEVANAFVAVMKSGSEPQLTRARDVLSQARRDLYRILADGDEGGDATVERDPSTR